MYKKLLVLFVLGILTGAYFFIKNYYHIDENALFTAIKPPSRDVAKLLNENPSQSGPFTIFGDYKISVFADLGKESPRVLAFDANGVLYASIPSLGKIVALPDKNKDDVADEIKTVISDLNSPHGFFIYNNNLYIAETGRVISYFYFEDEFRVSAPEELFELPSGGRHFTRTIKVNDDNLYTTVGSSCDVCQENDSRRAAILVSDMYGKNLEVFASGLRNTVFFDFDSEGNIWGSDMGRDFLGDNLPPDELNNIKKGKNYGWPFCFGKQVRDSRHLAEVSFNCSQTEASSFDYPAHIAPLGTTFIKPGVLPEEYEGDLLVSFHGSWNSSVKVGYKIVRIDFENGKPIQLKDFVSGFLDENDDVLGRPVDLIFDSEGKLYISDDKANLIYVVSEGSAE